MSDVDVRSPVKWLKRQADICVSLGALCGVCSAVILGFGGSIPPWYTPAQAQEYQRQSAQIQSDTVTALGKINDNLAKLAKRVDQGDCDKLRMAVDQANTALARNPNDPLAHALRDGTLSRMREIQGCIP